jgi:hypothetical protein
MLSEIGNGKRAYVAEKRQICHGGILDARMVDVEAEKEMVTARVCTTARWLSNGINKRCTGCPPLAHRHGIIGHNGPALVLGSTISVRLQACAPAQPPHYPPPPLEPRRSDLIRDESRRPQRRSARCRARAILRRPSASHGA